jgi:hypothetical protein
MSILTTAQITAAAAAFANQQFVAPKVTANLSTTQIIAGITAIDTAMASTVASYSATYGPSGLNVANTASGFGAAVSAAVPGSTSEQQGIMLLFWTAALFGITIN